MKDILVHLDGGAEDEVRLSYAEVLAAEEAHVTGLFANVVPSMPMVATPDASGVAAQVFAQAEAEAHARGDALAPRLSERLARFGARSDVVRLDGQIGDIETAAVSAARLADLFITTAPYREGAGEWDGLVEAVLMGAGRSLLLVPPGQPARGPFGRILVAWRDTREAARAMAEALALMGAASRVDILLVDPPGEGAPGAGIAAHLARHGARAEVKIVQSAGRTVAEVMQEEAARGAIDLIVMGAYGQSRLREWIFGGTTRDLLSATAVPVLTAH